MHGSVQSGKAQRRSEAGGVIRHAFTRGKTLRPDQAGAEVENACNQRRNDRYQNYCFHRVHLRFEQRCALADAFPSATPPLAGDGNSR
ncbi:hypothetical protein D3C85_796500 [compost metagenome]